MDHVHCIVTGGGLSADQTRWVSSSPTFLFSVKVMSAVFRGKFIDGLRAAYTRGHLTLREGDGDVRTFRSRERVQKRTRNGPNRLTPRASRGTPHLLSP